MSWIRGLFGRSDDDRQVPGSLAPATWLPFPTIVVPGSSALEERASRLGANATPVVMGGQDDLAILRAAFAESMIDSASLVEAAMAVDVEAWLAARASSDPDYYSVEPAEWPDGDVPGAELSLHLDTTSGAPKREVLIGLPPTPRSWETPAHLGFGGWNECPEATVHVALHAAWHRAYESDIVAISGDVIECAVARPPANRDEALELARQHFLYCPDIVHQGVQSIENLAALLMASRVWSFWWD